MELRPTKNHADSFEAVIESLKNSRNDRTKTIELLHFLRNEIESTPQWFVISLDSLILIVQNDTYYGRSYEVKLTAWSYQNKYHFNQLGPHNGEQIFSFSEKLEAKKFVEDYLMKPPIEPYF